MAALEGAAPFRRTQRNRGNRQAADQRGHMTPPPRRRPAHILEMMAICCTCVRMRASFMSGHYRGCDVDAKRIFHAACRSAALNKTLRELPQLHTEVPGEGPLNSACECAVLMRKQTHVCVHVGARCMKCNAPEESQEIKVCARERRGACDG